MTDTPLILTLRFDDESAGFFETQRRRHFPPRRNLIPAHLTLFHALPGEEIDRIARDVEAVAAASSTIGLSVAGLRFLGYGSAYEIRSPRLSALRADLAARWSHWLTPQDAQKFAPHVTIQNKALAPAAKALYEELSSAFEPFAASATGLLLWHYRGGPWEPAGTFDFGAPQGEAMPLGPPAR